MVSLPVQTLLLELVVVAPNYVLPGRPSLSNDSMFYQYVGWLWMYTDGAPYLNVADMKPPATQELAAALSLLSGGDPFWLAATSAATMALAAVATVTLVGMLVYEHTGNGAAAYLAGTVPLAYPWYYQLAAGGLRPKYGAAAFGLLGVLLLLRRRYVLAGLTTALAAAFWQLVLIFLVAALWVAARDSRRAAVRTVGGGLAAVVLVLAPIALSDPRALEALFVQVVLAAPLIPVSNDLLPRTALVLQLLSFATPLVLIGVVGAVRSRAYDRAVWLPVVLGWFVFAAFWLKLDGRPDLFLLLVVSAVGVGLATDSLGTTMESLDASVGAQDAPAGAPDAFYPVAALVAITAAVMFLVHARTYGSSAGVVTPDAWGFQLDFLLRYHWEQPVFEGCYLRGDLLRDAIAENFGPQPDGDACLYDTRAILRRWF